MTTYRRDSVFRNASTHAALIVLMVGLLLVISNACVAPAKPARSFGEPMPSASTSATPLWTTNAR